MLPLMASGGGGTPNSVSPTSVFPSAVTSLNAYGDSIMAGTVLPFEKMVWAELVSQALLNAALANNFGTSGARIMGTGFCASAYAQTPTAAVGSIILSGANEVADCVGSATNQATIQSAQQAVLVWLALPASQKVIYSSMSTTGSGWSTHTAVQVGNGLGESFDNTVNDTIFATVTGSVIYVAGETHSPYTSQFSVKVDGVSQGTFNISNALSNSTTACPWCLRFTGFTAASHTVTITITTGTGNNYTFIQWVGANGTSSQTPFVAACTTLLQASNATTIGTMNTNLSTVITNLAADGLNVVKVDTNSVLAQSQTPDQYQDIYYTGGAAGLHPSILGNEMLAAYFVKQMYTATSFPASQGKNADIFTQELLTAGVTAADLAVLVKQFRFGCPPTGQTQNNNGYLVTQIIQSTGQPLQATLRNVLASSSFNGTALAAIQSGVSLVAAGANISAGLYRISYSATITQAATTSCTLGGMTVTYTDNDTNASVTTLVGPTNSTNAIGSQVNGCVVINAKTGTAITFSFGYVSSGATAMQYALHVGTELLG